MLPSFGSPVTDEKCEVLVLQLTIQFPDNTVVSNAFKITAEFLLYPISESLTYSRTCLVHVAVISYL